MTDMNGWWTTLAWVIISVSLAYPVLYLLGALLTGVMRLFRREPHPD